MSLHRNARSRWTALQAMAVVVVAVVVAVVLMGTAGLFRLSGFYPGPALPAGATALALGTKPAGPLPGYCPGGSVVPPARIAVSGAALVLVPEAGGEPLNVGFPHGWAAWRIGGVAELVSRDGVVVVVRPDQYVAAVLPLDATAELAAFLEGVFLPA